MDWLNLTTYIIHDEMSFVIKFQIVVKEFDIKYWHNFLECKSWFATLIFAVGTSFVYIFLIGLGVCYFFFQVYDFKLFILPSFLE